QLRRGPLLLRPLLRRAGHLPRRRPVLAPMVPRHPPRTAPAPGHRRQMVRRPRRKLRHRHGPDHPPDAPALSADLPAVIGQLAASPCGFESVHCINLMTNTHAHVALRLTLLPLLLPLLLSSSLPAATPALLV